MWLLDIMEIDFGAAMVCIVADYAKRYYGRWRPYIVGVIATGSFVVSLIDLGVNWFSYKGIPSSVQPFPSVFASLYVISNFTVVVILTTLTVGIVVSLYSWKFLSEQDNAGPFYALLLLLITSVIGVVSSGDFLTLFLFWEGMSISAYALVAFYKDSQISLEASLKYIFLAGAGSLLALYGISLIYSAVGSIRIEDLSSLLSSNPQFGVFALIITILGFGVEAAIFPLHTWLPDVYSAAPTPISAIISGIVTEAGIFVLVKIVYPFVTTTNLFQGLQVGGLLRFSPAEEVQLVLAVLAVLTMLIGNLGGLVQTNVKRILAFSSIAQMGYMIAAISTFSVSGLIAVVFNIWNHGIVKSGFFLLSGIRGRNYEDSELQNIQGLGQTNRTVGVMYASSSLAMVGSPPFGMFWSELLIVEALFSASSQLFFAIGVIVVLDIFLSIGYYARILNRVVLTPPESGDAKKTKSSVSLGLLLPPMILIALSLLSGLLPFLILNQIRI